jgi:hypothetical protein
MRRDGCCGQLHDDMAEVALDVARELCQRTLAAFAEQLDRAA